VLGNISDETQAAPPRKPPVVAEHWVYGPGLPAAGLRLDRPAWGAWLSAPTTTSFSYPLVDRQCGCIIGFMTVRKEQRQRGGAYWTAYRRQGRTLRKIYLGPSQRITQARLEAVAATLLREGQQREGEKDTHTRPEG
jgi:LuxR family transcriptional regulator, maltose regulon positive regulatory protein